jgi:hypothetical protein
MELMEDLDPEEARAIIDPALKLMIDAVRRLRRAVDRRRYFRASSAETEQDVWKYSGSPGACQPPLGCQPLLRLTEIARDWTLSPWAPPPDAELTEAVALVTTAFPGARLVDFLAPFA